MALIGEIRKRSGLLLLMIGGALLLFVLSDAFGPGSGAQQTNSIGTVDGVEIDNFEFEIEVQRRVANAGIIYGDNNTQYTEFMRNQLWRKARM